MLKIAVAIVVKNSKVLMVRRRVKTADLSWQFPGGKVEAGEDEAQAARREVWEETTINCRPGRTLGHRPHPTHQILIHYWLCDYQSGRAAIGDTDEIDRVAWMTPEEIFTAVSSDIFPPVRTYLEKLSLRRSEEDQNL